MGEPEGTFVDYQTTMVKTAKAIAVTVQEMVRQGGGGCLSCPLEANVAFCCKDLGHTPL